MIEFCSRRLLDWKQFYIHFFNFQLLQLCPEELYDITYGNYIHPYRPEAQEAMAEMYGDYEDGDYEDEWSILIIDVGVICGNFRFLSNGGGRIEANELRPTQ